MLTEFLGVLPNPVWVEIGANWEAGKPSCDQECGSFSVKYRVPTPSPLDRQYRMQGKVQMEGNGEMIAVSIECRAYGGKRRDAERKTMVSIGDVAVGEPRSWPISEVNLVDRVREFVRSQLSTFADKCKRAWSGK